MDPHPMVDECEAVRMGHSYSLAASAEPALAIADIVVGAVLSGYSGDGRYRKVLAHKITELVIDP